MLYNQIVPSEDVSFTEICEGEEAMSQTNPNVFIYALGNLGSYSSQVAYIIAQSVLNTQGTYPASGTQAVKEQYAEPVLRLTKTNDATIKGISGSEIGVVPFANKLGGMVKGNSGLIHLILEQGEDISIVGWYSLKVRHVLAAKRGVKIEDIKEIHSHPQAIAQCGNELEKLGTIQTKEIQEGESYELGEGEALICKAQNTRSIESRGYVIKDRGIQDSDGDETQRYTLFTRPGDQGRQNFSTIVGSHDALECCKDSIQKYGNVVAFEEDSTNAYIPSLGDDSAVICSIDSANSNELDILHEQFCPEDNHTYFAFLRKAKKEGNVPGLEEFSNDKRLFSIFFTDQAQEESIRKAIKASGIKILFEDGEDTKGGQLCLGIMESVKNNSILDELQTSINGLGGRMKVI